jgi:hypothetical protein
LFLVVFIQTQYGIAADTGAVVRIMFEDAEAVTIKAVQSISRTEPHETFFILHYGCYRIAGDPVACLIVPEIIRLCMCSGLHSAGEQQ